MSVDDALRYALDLNSYLGQPTEPEHADPAITQRHGEQDRQAPEWFFEGREQT